MWHREIVRLGARPKGVHLVTGEVEAGVPELARFHVGLAHVFCLHTSASLAINENADPDVRADLEEWLDRAVREDEPWMRHTLEGPDDLPAHVRTVLTGSSLTIPIVDGRFGLGTWQGIYLCEHRVSGGPRSLVVTLHGEGE